MEIPARPLDLRRAVTASERLTQLQARAARLGTPHAGEEDVAAMRAADAELRAAITAGDVPAAIDADDAFHEVLVRASGDLELAAEVRGLRQLIRRLDTAYFSARTLELQPADEHDGLIEAVIAGDAETAAELTERNWHRLVSRMSRIVGEPDR